MLQQNTYKGYIEKYTNKLKSAQNKSRIIAYLRAVVFFLGIFLAVLVRSSSAGVLAIVIITSFSVFLFLVRKSYVLSLKIKFLKAFIEINTRELDALKGDFSNFHAGTEFKDYEHSFSFDLDICKY